ncbi:MAG: histidine kinase dimerization/phosphoacceptor domain -containing protein [Anaerolineae bacterium]
MARIWKLSYPNRLAQSLRLRLLALVVVLLSATLLFGAASTLYFISQTEARAWQGRQGEAVHYAAATVAAFTNRVGDTLRLASLLDRSEIEHSPLLLNLLHQEPSLVEIVRLDAGGNVVGSAFADRAVLVQPDLLPRTREWGAQASTDQPFLAMAQLASGERALVMAVRVPTGGAVVGRLRMDVLLDVVANIHFGRTGRAYVTSRDGRLIAHTNRTLIDNTPKLAPNAVPLSLVNPTSQESFGEYNNLEGVSVVGAVAEVPDTDWLVIAEVERQEAYETTATAFWLLLGGIAAFGIAALLITRRILTHSIFEPIEALRAGAIRIGEGDRLHRIAVGWQDEIGTVADAFNEMTDRLKAHEDQLEAGVREKEVLLQEIHHRVKNNMQIIASLLNLQLGTLTDPVARATLRDSQTRIRAMALVHEKLYRSTDLSRIDLETYIRSLTASLYHTYAPNLRQIEMTLALQPIGLGIDRAIPCGLILNELVTNALKHAFPNGQPGNIQVELTATPDGRVRLAVSDNGVGLPDGLDIEKLDSLGLQLVDTLTAQIGGQLEISRAAGARFTITFVDSEAIIPASKNGHGAVGALAPATAKPA